MRFCQSCGTALPEGSTACPACGAFQTTTSVPGTASVPGAAGVPSATIPVAAAPPASAGIAPNLAAALAYFGGVITGILFLVIEPSKNDRFVRFHAFQSIFFNVAWVAFWIVWMVVGIVLGAMSKGLFFIIQIPVNLVLFLGGFCLWLYLMYVAYQGKTLKLPIIGPLAAKQAGI